MALHPGKLWALGLDNSLTVLEPDIARPPHELRKRESKAGRSSVVAGSTSMRENLLSTFRPGQRDRGGFCLFVSFTFFNCIYLWGRKPQVTCGG